MSVSSILGGLNERRLVGEIPLYLQPGQHGHHHLKAPQRKIDEFWRKFTTKAPGKASTVLPKNEYAERLARRTAAKEGGSGTATQASFEEAAALCRAKVDKIIEECRRVNQKYRDPHFDLEFDLKTGQRDCLESLDNTKDDSSDSETESIRSRRRHPPPSPPPPRRRAIPRPYTRLEGDGTGEVLGSPEKHTPQGRVPGSRFAPKSVKRVGEIFDEPKFYIDGPTANDVRQGRDGDCWLMAALCTLSNKPGLIERICVHHDVNVGVYGFVFHRDGEWYSEIIDDKLYLTKPDYDEAVSDRINIERILWDDRERPDSEEIYRKTYQSNSGALYFAQCENPNETWLPLLEKAYAKAHGDYAAIEGGFTGEGIEDLTGGVTSELFTTDILDKENFWKNELMQVNKEFLFGCSTGLWGRGFGDRKGIVELHAYSVMRAVEMDGERLLLLKNPWGKTEWKGPWSDGSKEWTPEWLQKLEHRFGDDGAFWISYKELLRKYQNFDRTRLFGPDWKITSIWTTLAVPWTLEYHDTKFAFTITKPGPVVIVLSQLDDRYFRGLEGQYRFKLGFRVHKAGQDDYLVRTRGSYRMSRSANLELELEAGEYVILVKIDADRFDDCMPPEDVVRKNAKGRREKLLRIGLAYDLAHGKAKVVETPEEKVAREAYVKRRKDKQRERLRKNVMDEKRRRQYENEKRKKQGQKMLRRDKERQKAKKGRREAKEAAKREAEEKEPDRKEAEEKEPDRKVAEAGEHNDGSRGIENNQGSQPSDHTSPKNESKKLDMELGLEGKTKTEPGASQETQAQPELGTEDENVKINTPEPETSTDAGESTPPASSSSLHPSETAGEDTPVGNEAGREAVKLETTASGSNIEEEDGTTVTKPAESVERTLSEDNPKPSVSKDTDTRLEVSNSPETAKSEQAPVGENKPEASGADVKRERHPDDARPARFGPEVEEKLRRAIGAVSEIKEELEVLLRSSQPDHPFQQDQPLDQPRDRPYYSSDGSPPPSARTRPTHHRNHRLPPPPPPLVERLPLPDHRRHHPPPPGPRQPDFGPHHRFDPPQRFDRFNPPHPSRGPNIPFPQPPERGRFQGYGSDNGLPSDSDEDALSSLESISDISERDLDYMMADSARRNDLGPPGRPMPPMPMGHHNNNRFDRDSDAEFERDPWNAVAVVGLKVYYRVAEGDQEEEIVKLRVVRPNPYDFSDDEEMKKDEEKEEGGEEKDEAKVLDLDDSAKDATTG
ncbi:hypothetical protein B0H67DRAFT_552699 [Lasiosphaeris hirsuta]|uniref:Calpain catalytic domain-containing protein n=1 Tax=Lasiosphaeris hirsuta TaxID=260670 RepID=A0AA40DXX7_9PEZI|nr:hypothetical protein B0H67DRAFT_552699 [Lasiosphaeris hirsuta]